MEAEEELILVRKFGEGREIDHQDTLVSSIFPQLTVSPSYKPADILTAKGGGCLNLCRLLEHRSSGGVHTGMEWKGVIRRIRRIAERLCSTGSLFAGA